MTDRFGLKDKVVIVTGAARGISREIAITFADDSTKFYLNQ
jgi:NAD(P)-dependent dehydrogenase (short-subunit alcohol dehydrogenase family)